MLERVLAPTILTCAIWAASATAADNQIVRWSGPQTEVLRLNTPYLLEASSSSGLPVKFSVLHGPAAIEGSTVTVTNSGTIWLNATVAGDGVHASTNALRAINVKRFQFRPVANIPLYARGLRARGNLVYLSDIFFGLRIFDVSIPARPREIGSHKLADWGTRQLDLVENIAYVPIESKGIAIIDIGDPTSPVLLGEAGKPEAGERVAWSAVAVRANLLYAADLQNGLRVFDVGAAVSSAPIFADTGFFGALGITLNGNHAYVTDSNKGLRVMDIKNPESPIQIAAAFTNTASLDGRSVYDLQISQEYCFMADWRAGLFVLDVSEASRPTLVSVYPKPVTSVNVLGSYAYVGGDGFFEVLDVSLPSMPIAVGEYRHGGPIWRIERNESYVYVAAGNGGLDVLEERAGFAQSLSFNLPPELSAADRPFTLKAEETTGLPVTYTVVAGHGFVDGDKLYVTGNGELKVRAEQEGNEDFLPASAERTAIVVSAPPRLEASMKGDVITLQWSDGLMEFILAERERLEGGTGWAQVKSPVIKESGLFRVDVTVVGSARFFRLLPESAFKARP